EAIAGRVGCAGSMGCRNSTSLLIDVCFMIELFRRAVMLMSALWYHSRKRNPAKSHSSAKMN
ncbi:Uncharacterized protein DAT39_011817, partial [Clarias magur]